ncbi:MAG: enoyl-CoA hydratase [Salinarimonadaceae bacterium]|nr:MAG: enoyl-CoA hydratase [Salinarimonadaceae bacterium]
MSDEATILLDKREGIARLVLSNPRRKNALTLAMWRALPDLVRACEDDPEVRALILAGAGGDFCSGADISEFRVNRADEAAARIYDVAVREANTALAEAGKPTVALVRGICYGGGVALALACDLRIAASDARFRIPAGRLGLGYSLSDIGLVAGAIGAAATADLVFSARVFDATDALRDGLVRMTFDTAEFDARAKDYVEAIAENAPLTLAAAKAALVELRKPDAARDPERVAAMVARCAASEDFAEGRAAFAEKRTPIFRGR